MSSDAIVQCDDTTVTRGGKGDNQVLLFCMQGWGFFRHLGKLLEEDMPIRRQVLPEAHENMTSLLYCCEEGIFPLGSRNIEGIHYHHYVCRGMEVEICKQRSLITLCC